MRAALISVLLVERNRERLSRLSRFLEGCGHDVVRCDSYSSALDALEDRDVKFVIANSNAGGVELASDLRLSGSDIPILITTDRGNRWERRRILSSGADGYIVFPIDFEELKLRMRNLLWRCRLADSTPPVVGGCSLNPDSLSVTTAIGEISLRKMEFLLLEKLLSCPGRVFTRTQLLDDVWGLDTQSDPRTVDTHIKRLRKAFRGVDGISIQTVRGLGYRLVVVEPSSH